MIRVLKEVVVEDYQIGFWSESTPTGIWWGIGSLVQKMSDAQWG